MMLTTSNLPLAVLVCFAGVGAALTGWPSNLGPSATPLDTTPPKLPGGSVANTQPVGPLFQDFTAPFPTNTWWVGYGVGKQTNSVAGPFPYTSSAQPAGVRFGLPTTRKFDGTSVLNTGSNEYTVNAVEMNSTDITAHKATQWDTQTVTIKYFSASRANNMFAYLAPGSAYMTFEYQNATPLITTSNGQVQSINGAAVKAGNTYSGTSFQLVTSTTTYVLYF